MSDTSRWRLAKRVFHAILADGIPLDAEPAALDAWAQRFNARDAAGRRAVLGEMTTANGLSLFHVSSFRIAAAIPDGSPWIAPRCRSPRP